MSTLTYVRQADWIIGDGYKTLSFNIPGDPSGVLVDGDVRYHLNILRDGGGTVDLSQVNVYLRSPDGERQTIYNQIWNAPGRDDDEGRDSDSADDHDIYFSGNDSVSKDGGFNGNGVNGTWKLEVDNDSGFNLRMQYLQVWVDYKYPPAPDMAVTDLVFTGNPTYDELMTIQAKLENKGDQYAGPFEARLYINDQYVESSFVTLGLFSGQSWTENFTFRATTTGSTKAEVKLVGLDGDDRFSSNDSRVEYFTPKQGDLAITDIRYTGNPTVGEFMTVQADVTNIGDGNLLWENVEVKLFINDEYVESSFLTAGLFAGQTKQENFSFIVDNAGTNDVRLEIENIDGERSFDNNISTSSFVPKQGDLTVSDVRYVGNPTVGEWMTIEADISNIGTGDVSWEFVTVDLYLNGEFEESSTIFTGLDAGDTKQENFSFVVRDTGTIAVELRVEEIEADSNLANNRYVGEFTPEQLDVTTSLVGKGTEIQLAAHIVNVVYGDASFPSQFRGDDTSDNGLDDDYTAYFESLFNRTLEEDGSFTVGETPEWEVMDADALGSHFAATDLGVFRQGGLWDGRAYYEEEDRYSSYVSQALLTKGLDADGDTTLVLGMRGTDDPLIAITTGEAFTGSGQANYYEGLQPLIDAAISYANDDANQIDKLIVTGHSLAGAMVDLFTAVDASRVDSEVELHAISIASAGLDADVLEYFDSHDTSVIEDLPFIYDMNAPDFYIGLSHTGDTVTFPEANNIGQNLVLFTQQRFIDGLHPVELPNVDNDDKPGLFNFKAEHSSGLYAATLGGLGRDALLDLRTDEKLIIGNADIPNVRDLDGEVIEAFADYQGAGPDDEIIGTSGAEYILGLEGNDTLRGMGGNDLISGGQGDDLIYSGDGADISRGGEGDDIVVGGDGDDDLQGDAGNDLLIGGAGNDTLNGNDGDDTFEGGLGDDALNGGAGIDTADYTNQSGRIVASLDSGIVTVDGGPETDVLEDIENITGSNFNDRIIGDNEDNHLIGGQGDDIINGRGGADRIEGGHGQDTLSGDGDSDSISGGEGNDVLLGLGGADVLAGDDGNDRIEAGLGNDTAEGGLGDDLIFGNFGWDVLTGGEGNDSLRGGGARDTLEGGVGNDHLVGGNGIDVLNGGAGNDVLTGGNGDALGDTVRDVFVFAKAANGGGGFDRVRDFEDTIDKLDLTDLGYADFDEVLAGTTDVGAHMEINLKDAGIVRVENFQLSDFGLGDVLI